MSAQVLDWKIFCPEDSTWTREWDAIALLSDECLSYAVAHKKTHEAIAVDPKDDPEVRSSIETFLESKHLLAVIDTHTHADHISAASVLADAHGVPYLTHELAPTRRAHLRISGAFSLRTGAGALRFLPTPGHTPDSFAVQWGPFFFSGDTVLHGDSGRDDLPGGDAEIHFESLQRLKAWVPRGSIMLPGHDGKGGRASIWKTQLEINPSLKQSRDQFVPEARAFKGNSPRLLKEALFENFK